MKQPRLKDRAGDVVFGLLRQSETPRDKPQAGEPVKQQTGKPSNRHSTRPSQKPVAKVSRKPTKVRLLMKTFYIAPDDVELLMRESLKRQSESGSREGADHSSLVREAIRKTFGKK